MADIGNLAEEPKRGWRDGWRRRLAITGIVLLVLGILGAATTFGWLLRGWVPGSDVGTKKVVVQRPIVVAAAAPTGTLPNVLGLSIAQARQAYADAGVEPTTIEESRVPYFAQPGTIIEQRPAAAARLDKGTKTFTLLVATPAHMPQLVGVSGDAARTRLEKLGVGATTIVRYEDSVDPVSVARTRPAAGERVTARATLVVSEAPSSVNLSDLTAGQNDCNFEDSTLMCEVLDEEVTIEYEINDRVTGFESTLALADAAPTGAGAVLVVKRGTRAIGSFKVTDTPRDIRVEVPGGTRLILEIRRSDSGEESVGVVLTDPRIVGARSGIDALVKGETP